MKPCNKSKLNLEFILSDHVTSVSGSQVPCEDYSKPKVIAVKRSTYYLFGMLSLQSRGRDVAQAVEHSAGGFGSSCMADRSCIGHAFAVWDIFYSNQWSTGCGMLEGAYKRSIVVIGKSNICGSSRFPLKKCVTIAIYLMLNSQ